MLRDYPLHDDEPDAGARVVDRVVEALEGGEKFFGVGHVETHPVVAHEIDLPAVGLFGAEFDQGKALLPGKLEGVAEEIVESYPHEPRIGEGREAGRDIRLGLISGFLGQDFRDGFAGKDGEVHGHPVHLLPRDPRELEEVLDEFAHMQGGCPDPLKIMDTVPLQGSAVLRGEEFAEAIQGAQGGTEIMGYRIGKGLQFLVGRFQLGSPVLDPGFQFLVELPDFLLDFELFLLHRVERLIEKAPAMGKHEGGQGNGQEHGDDRHDNDGDAEGLDLREDLVLLHLRDHHPIRRWDLEQLGYHFFSEIVHAVEVSRMSEYAPDCRHIAPVQGDGQGERGRVAEARGVQEEGRLPFLPHDEGLGALGRYGPGTQEGVEKVFRIYPDEEDHRRRTPFHQGGYHIDVDGVIGRFPVEVSEYDLIAPQGLQDQLSALLPDIHRPLLLEVEGLEAFIEDGGSIVSFHEGNPLKMKGHFFPGPRVARPDPDGVGGPGQVRAHRDHLCHEEDFFAPLGNLVYLELRDGQEFVVLATAYHRRFARVEDRASEDQGREHRGE